MNTPEILEQLRHKAFADNPQITLGELISLLREQDPSRYIRFDFGTAVPTQCDSYRGSYDEIALGYRLSGYDCNSTGLAEPKVKETLAELERAVGSTFTGWKGGDYIMTKDTPIWAENPGNASNTGITGALLGEDSEVVITTAYCRYLPEHKRLEDE